MLEQTNLVWHGINYREIEEYETHTSRINLKVGYGWRWRTSAKISNNMNHGYFYFECTEKFDILTSFAIYNKLFSKI